MADIINLRRVRKRIERTHRQVAATEARIRFGRPKSTRQAERLEAERQKDHLDGHSGLANATPSAKGSEEI